MWLTLDDLQKFTTFLRYHVGGAVFLPAFLQVAAFQQKTEYALESGVGARFSNGSFFEFGAGKLLPFQLFQDDFCQVHSVC